LFPVAVRNAKRSMAETICSMISKETTKFAPNAWERNINSTTKRLWKRTKNLKRLSCIPNLYILTKTWSTILNTGAFLALIKLKSMMPIRWLEGPESVFVVLNLIHRKYLTWFAASAAKAIFIHWRRYLRLLEVRVR